MNNENRKRNKRLFITLIVCAAVAAIAITAVAIALGLSSANDTLPPDGPGIVQDDEKPDDKLPDTPNDDEDIDTDLPDDPSDETSGTPVYGLPVASYELGQECVTDELVWSNTLHWYSTHNGTDFRAEAGTAVSAIVDGTVKSVKYTTQEGYVVAIEGTDGYTAYYKSLSADTLVEEGDTVTTGTQIGYVSDSMTSEQNDGPHLHLEILDAEGNYIDPMSLLGETEK